MSSVHGENDELSRAHTSDAIADRIRQATRHSYLGDFVLGAVDGAVTTFAIVAGAAGAGFSNRVALVLGMANVLADGFSMAASNYLKSMADRQQVERFRRIEEMHIERIPDGEREEIRQIFASKGFNGNVLEEVVQTITNDRQQWVDTMLTEEFGLQLMSPVPWRAGFSTFIAFTIAGLVPLSPLLFAIDGPAGHSFAASSVLTGITFFVIGYIRGRTVEYRPWRTGLETLLIGGAAASLAYFVAALLRSMSIA